MTCHPIIFQAESVRAILDGRKTQTRRIIRSNRHPVPPDHVSGETLGPAGGRWWCDPGGWIRCPYGDPGGLLWLREAWAPHPLATQDPPERVLYRADGANHGIDGRGPVNLDCPDWTPYRWRSPIFMPRWASRLTLRITDVRVQRVQEISEADARAEGCHAQEWCTDPASIDRTSARGDYASLWDSINGKRAPWDFNPWVWALTFEVVP